MASDEEKRRRFQAVCADSHTVDELCDGVLGCAYEEPIEEVYDKRLPHTCYEDAEDRGITLDGCVGKDLGLDLSDDDIAMLLRSRSREDLVEGFVDDAPDRVCYTCALDFAEGYLKLMDVSKARQASILNSLKKQLEGVGSKPSRRKDEPATEPLYIFKEELVRMIDRYLK